MRIGYEIIKLYAKKVGTDQAIKTQEQQPSLLEAKENFTVEWLNQRKKLKRFC